MNKRILTFCGILILFIATVGFTQTARTASQIAEFDVNGMKVIFKHRPGAPTVAAGLFIRGGTRSLNSQPPGVENFMLSAAVEGSVKFPQKTMRRALAQNAASIGSRSLYDYSVLALGVPRQNFSRSWDIFADIALNPTFVKEDVDLTREKILTAIRSSDDDPDEQLQRSVDKVMLSKTSYGNDPIGTAESISRLTAADLAAYHKKTMEASRLLLVVVGDLDAEELKRLVNASFGKLVRGNFKEPDVPALDFSRPTLDITSRSIETNYINGIFAAPSLKDSDYYAMRVAIALLQARVFEEVRTKRNLSYAPNAELGSLAANTGAIYVTAVDANQSVGLMLKEIEKLRTEQVDESEIKGTAGYFLTTYYLKQETNAAQAEELAKYELIGGGWRNSLDFLDRIRKVKAEDVQAVAIKYMRNLRFMVIGNPAQIDRSVFLQNYKNERGLNG